MNPITKANLESPLIQALASNKATDPFSYRFESHYPNFSRERVSVQPVVAPSGSTHGSELIFKLPRYGLVQKACIQCDLTCGATDNTASSNDSRLGSRVFQSIELRSHNKVLATMPRDYCDSRIQSADAVEALNYSYVTNCNSFNNETITVYTPLFLPCFEKSSLFLDLSFCEQLDLVCTVATQAQMGLAAGALTSATYTLHVWYLSLDNKEYEALVAKQFPVEPH